PAPHVLEDGVGLELAGLSDEWRARPDMNPVWTAGYRASIVARARFIEDLVAEEAARGLSQYVILGAGLDSYVQRHPEMAGKLTVYELDEPATQAWKRGRLEQLGYGVPGWLRLVPVDFEKDASWRRALEASGFQKDKGALTVSTGVSMYLTREAIRDTLRQAAGLAPGSILAMTFLLPLELVDKAEQAQYAMVQEKAKEAGTPFRSLFTPDEMLALARECGFQKVRHVGRDEMVARYFAARPDGLRPASGEEFLVARV
ncbi:MAG TPA: class I SAM-dependent methyltransferase, partial [bacterium]|nr:class I SAM-dependent methyltransferase [bacterium]